MTGCLGIHRGFLRIPWVCSSNLCSWDMRQAPGPQCPPRRGNKALFFGAMKAIIIVPRQSPDKINKRTLKNGVSYGGPYFFWPK